MEPSGGPPRALRGLLSWSSKRGPGQGGGAPDGASGGGQEGPKRSPPAVKDEGRQLDSKRARLGPLLEPSWGPLGTLLEPTWGPRGALWGLPKNFQGTSANTPSHSRSFWLLCSSFFLLPHSPPPPALPPPYPPHPSPAPPPSLPSHPMHHPSPRSLIHPSILLLPLPPSHGSDIPFSAPKFP